MNLKHVAYIEMLVLEYDHDGTQSHKSQFV